MKLKIRTAETERRPPARLGSNGAGSSISRRSCNTKLMRLLPSRRAGGRRSTLIALLAVIATGFCASQTFAAGGASTLRAEFTPGRTAYRWSLEELWNRSPDLPLDWTDYNFLVLEMRASSSERFQLQIFTTNAMVAKRIQPFQNTWVRAAIPLVYYRKPAREGSDLAATYNKHRDSYWININFGGWAPIHEVVGIGVQMDEPVGKPVLEIRSIQLAKEDPGDAVLDPKVVVDEFGQWIPADWRGKARNLNDLKKAWADENASLKPGNFGFDQYGGYKNTHAKATGFFRVEQMDGRWWFVDPDGHLFYSIGANGIGTGSGTPTAGRTNIFAALPAPTGGRGNRGGGGGASFYTWNLQRRYGDDFNSAWGELTFRRLDAWGFNTVAGFGGTPPVAITKDGARKPYTIMLRGQTGPSIMGMPDVYSPEFEQRVDQMAQRCAELKDDPYLLGYFVGNEPPWPTRESMLCDALLAGLDSAIKSRLTEFLKAGDTPERRKQFAYDAFDHFLAVLSAAIKKYDPNHLNLGIRLGGEVPDEVIKACRVFDVCSINVYEFAIPQKTLDRYATLTGRPLIGGEFHFGAPERGLGGGLRQVASQTERGVAYQYYVEHAASHPSVIGMHWFQWIDQPSTGRNDGENYNIGFVDVTDRPYEEMIDAVVRAHQRLYEIHAGKTAPTKRQAKGASTAEP
jgi:hypothetical protein